MDLCGGLRTLSSNGSIVYKHIMYNFYLDQELVDTELILSDGTIRIHGIVLASESKVAYEIMDSLPGPSRTLKFTQYSKEVMRCLIEYIYRGSVTYHRILETQIKSLAKFLKLDGISFKKEHISTKHKTESFGATHDLIRNIKPEEEVIEISDEEYSINTTILPTTSSPTKMIPEEPIDKIQHQTNSLLCSPISQNGDQCKSSDENSSDSTFYEPLSENERSENNIEISPTKSPELFVLLEAKNTNNSTFPSLTSGTCLSIPPKENDSAIPSKSLEGNNTNTFDDVLPNLGLNKNPYAKMIKKKVPVPKKVLNFLTEPSDKVIQNDDFVETSPSKENSQEMLQIGAKPSKISIISQHIITSGQEHELPSVSIRTDRPGNSSKEVDMIETKIKPRRRSNKFSKKHCDKEKINLNATTLSRKYCLLCDRVQTNFRMHLQYNHKEVIRKATSMCDKCYKTFYFECYKDNHDCE